MEVLFHPESKTFESVIRLRLTIGQRMIILLFIHKYILSI